MSATNYVNKVVSKMTATWPFPNPVSLGFSINEEALGKSLDEEIFSESPASLGICITHAMGPSGKGGVTIAWRKASNTKNARMVEVAVAYCSSADTFTKKIGKNTAWYNFMAGMTVLVPARTNKSDDSIPTNLRDMFWYSLDI